MEEFNITFLPDNVSSEISATSSVMRAAAELRLPIIGNCLGMGTCGLCKVRIKSGQTSEIVSAEKNHITKAELSQGIRLACKCKPMSDLVVEIIGKNKETEVKND